MIHAESVDLYAQMGHDLLAGREVSTSMFSSLALPDVPKNIALVSMVGPLMKSDVCQSQGSRSLTMQVNAAAKDSSIDGIIILSEGCPGGQVDGTAEFANAITEAKKRKPVIGAVSGMACSAGYWPIASCTEAYAQSVTDIIGCIGVVGKMKNPKSADAANGSIVDVYSDLSPDKNGEFRSAEAFKQNILNPMATAFHNGVLAGRGDRLNLSAENVLSGKVYLAETAKQYGLIDGIMPMNKIIGRINFLSKNR
jgi:protease IV